MFGVGPLGKYCHPLFTSSRLAIASRKRIAASKQRIDEAGLSRRREPRQGDLQWINDISFPEHNVLLSEPALLGMDKASAPFGNRSETTWGGPTSNVTTTRESHPLYAVLERYYRPFHLDSLMWIV